MTADLDKLIAAVEAGGDDLLVLFDLSYQFGGKYTHVIDAFRGSLDAAKALQSALLPKHRVMITQDADGYHVGLALDGIWHAMIGASGPDLARAWLLAILRAYRGTLE